MTARFLVGDVRARMTELDDHSINLIACSPPFLALRSYLPDGHPDKALEIGSEQTPADYLDVLLELTTEWRRLLAPHGSIAIELGDTYAGSGGAGGDYNDNGLRDGQPKFRQAANWDDGKWGDGQSTRSYGSGRGPGWPLDKSLTGIPTLYAWSLAYGRNLLTGEPSPAGRWRIRNLRPWIRSNPPVGALGDKVRPATSYITVACVSADRWHDLDAVRSPTSPRTHTRSATARYDLPSQQRDGNWSTLAQVDTDQSAGAPPLDWLVDADTILDHELGQRGGPRKGGRPSISHGGAKGDPNGDRDSLGPFPTEQLTQGARGVHLRRALQAAGLLPPGPEADYYDISPRGYSGAHYAVWPPELVKLLIAEMCPRRVCVTCGEPSRRIVDTQRTLDGQPADLVPLSRTERNGAEADGIGHWRKGTTRTTLDWSDCGHANWRPGRILDPFVGSGTTLAVASGMGRDSIGIDLDERNADLARERVGMFLEVDYSQREATA